MNVATVEATKLPPPRFMNENEFEAWRDEDIKAEYLDGEVIEMAPASYYHSRSGAWLGSLLEFFVNKHQLGTITSDGNLTVRLREGLHRCPDVMFIAKSRESLIHETYLDGAPDLAIEFVSPESVVRDWHEKYLEYEAAGVREYWIVDQLQKRVTAFVLGDDRRFHPLKPSEGKLHSQTLPGFWIKLDWFWQGPEFDTYQMAKEIGIIS